MADLLLIGIGTGNPDHLTRQGEKAIREADQILIPRKGSEKSDLADLRRDICHHVLGDKAAHKIIEFDLPVRDADGDYWDGVESWHDAVALAWEKAVESAEQPVQKVAFLIWGDPSLYDSSHRIASRLGGGWTVSVVPGITALQALTAAHKIPLNTVGASVLITTGRKLRDDGWPESVETIAVMLDGECSFQSLDEENIEIWWGAFLGMKNEILISGPLKAVGNEIVETRAEARQNHGWIMDTYIMRRRKDV